MNILTKKLYQWQFRSLLSKICGTRIPRIGESGAKVNCFDIAIDKASEPYFHVRGIEGDYLVGRLWDGSSYETEAKIPIESIVAHDLFITHYRGFDEIKYRGMSDFLTRLYTVKWVLHPQNDAQEEKLELYLDSLAKSGDIQKINHEYVVTGTAITSIEKFEEEERRHVENVKVQRRILWLTIIIAFAALVQANVIKLPTIVDLTQKPFVEQKSHSK
jgi:hypothetical protein